METVYKIIGISVIGTVIALLLKKNNPEFAVLSTILTGIFVFYLIFDSLSYVISSINNLISAVGIDSDIIGVVLKICGIGLVSEYFCSIISDAGETAIAKKAEMAAKIIILAMTIPIVIRVVEGIFEIF